MIWLVTALLGALWGALLARRRGGNRLDMAQYAAGFAILGALIGVFAGIFLVRLV